MARETLTLAAAELRLAADEPGTFTGYAALFGVPVPSFNETVAKGAFTRTLAEHRRAGTMPAMLWGHSPNEVIGVWTAMREDATGLAVTGKLVTETRRAAEIYALLKAGARVGGLSIGFSARADERGKGGVRILKDVDLVEVSLTPFPAQPGAGTTSVRSFDRQRAAELAAFTLAARRTAASLKGSIR